MNPAPGIAHLSVILFVLMFVPIAVSASPYMDSAKAELLVALQEQLFNDRFAAADSLVRQYSDTYPDDPAGTLFGAVALITRMFDREEAVQASRFHSLLDTTLSNAAAIRDTASNTTSAWMSLWLGHAYAYRSLWEAHFGSMFDAIGLGRKARGEYTVGLDYDSSLYDIYFGLGLFHYWKSAKAGLLRRLGIIRNDMAKGIRQLQLAADSALVSGQSAQNALIWIFLDREEYDTVISLCTDALQRYPQGKSLLWPLARAYEETRKYDRAVETLLRLRERLAADPGNYYNLIECDMGLYRCYEKLDRPAEAKQIAERFEKYYRHIPEQTQRRQRSKIAFLRRAART